ncbi:hypothetical protein KM043_011011 [Ampulex compressa]|nr:hypothetical protein KM043_011011 [Ampulex compressa]
MGDALELAAGRRTGHHNSRWLLVPVGCFPLVSSRSSPFRDWNLPTASATAAAPAAAERAETDPWCNTRPRELLGSESLRAAEEATFPAGHLRQGLTEETEEDEEEEEGPRTDSIQEEEEEEFGLRTKEGERDRVKGQFGERYAEES